MFIDLPSHHIFIQFTTGLLYMFINERNAATKKITSKAIQKVT